MNYIPHKFIGRTLDDCKIIPIDGCPTKYIKISFNRVVPITFSYEDETFLNLLDWANMNLDFIVKNYGETYAFT